jgi:hypothetical protein
MLRAVGQLKEVALLTEPWLCLVGALCAAKDGGEGQMRESAARQSTGSLQVALCVSGHLSGWSLQSGTARGRARSQSIGAWGRVRGLLAGAGAEGARRRRILLHSTLRPWLPPVLSLMGVLGSLDPEL